MPRYQGAWTNVECYCLLAPLKNDILVHLRCEIIMLGGRIYAAGEFFQE